MSHSGTPRGHRFVGGRAQQWLTTLARVALAGVLFFASDQAGWITGETLGVDGGK